MSFQLLVAEIKTNKILFAETEMSDLSTQDFVYEHLTYVCTKFLPIPSITVKIKDDSIIAISRFIYLQIAKDLGISTIRAVIDKSSNKISVNKLAEKGDIILLDFDQIRSDGKAADYSWHIIFFERQLAESEREIFENMVSEHFKLPNYLSENEKNSAITSFEISHSGKCIEFKGLTPSENHEWANSFWQKLTNFHINVVKITSYQGRKFVIG